MKGRLDRVDRRDGLAFQGAMHSFVRAILLRLTGVNALMLNTQPHPPHIQVRQAVNGLRCKRHAIVGANRQRQSVFTKRALKNGTRRDCLRREETVTRQQVARMLIRNRQRIAIRPIPGTELSFEIRGPQIIRCGGRRRDDAGMRRCTTRSTFGDEPIPHQEIGGGARGRPVRNRRMTSR